MTAEEALAQHLQDHLGAWPPNDTVQVVGNPRRLQPAWDGGLVVAAVVVSPLGTVISVPPAAVAETEALADQTESPQFRDELAIAVGLPRRASPWLIFRWSSHAADLPPVGTWVEPEHPALPAWLHPFPGQVLATFDSDGAFLAGLGLKPHTRTGQELAVGTEERAWGRGLARRLVAQAGRAVLGAGGVPLYVHHPANIPSGRVADGAGFPDLGWRMLVVGTPPADSS